MSSRHNTAPNHQYQEEHAAEMKKVLERIETTSKICKDCTKQIVEALSSIEAIFQVGEQAAVQPKGVPRGGP